MNTCSVDHEERAEAQAESDDKLLSFGDVMKDYSKGLDPVTIRHMLEAYDDREDRWYNESTVECAISAFTDPDVCIDLGDGRFIFTSLNNRIVEWAPAFVPAPAWFKEGPSGGR